jgi:hypothetical protein
MAISHEGYTKNIGAPAHFVSSSKSANAVSGYQKIAFLHKRVADLASNETVLDQVSHPYFGFLRCTLDRRAAERCRNGFT